MSMQFDMQGAEIEIDIFEICELISRLDQFCVDKMRESLRRGFFTIIHNSHVCYHSIVPCGNKIEGLYVYYYMYVVITLALILIPTLLFETKFGYTSHSNSHLNLISSVMNSREELALVHFFIC